MQQALVERELSSEGPVHQPLSAGSKGTKRTVTVNLAESPLTWLHARGHIDDRRFAAGELLRRDWERAQMAPRVTMCWDPVRSGGQSSAGRLDESERQVAAKDRFDGAIAAAGSGLSDILWRVICAGESLPQAERALTWPVRSGKLVLGLALDRVADFYRVR